MTSQKEWLLRCQAVAVFFLMTIPLSCLIKAELQNQGMDAVAKSEVLNELRTRWGAADIVRDIKHIKEDMQKITKLQDDGDLSTNEALFYFLRMHDFDDNGKLDGHELIAAIRHSSDNEHNYPMQMPEIETIVDSFFLYDDNVDGFISYPELRKHLSTDGP